MLRITSLLTLIAALLVTSVAFATEELYAPSHGDLKYRFSDGRIIEMVYLDGATLQRSDGVTVHVDQWHNKIRQTGSDSISFDPHNGQLPEQLMEVELKWKHRYHLKNTKESYWRERVCRVTARGQLTITSGIFQNAWKVECTNQRTDRALPKQEITWYSSQGRVLLHHREWWWGNSPGSFEVELVGFSMEPQSSIAGTRAK